MHERVDIENLDEWPNLKVNDSFRALGESNLTPTCHSCGSRGPQGGQGYRQQLNQ